MMESEERLLSALAKMAQQYLETPDGRLDHQFMSAGESAVVALSTFGLVTNNGRESRWTDAGLQFLSSH